MTENKKGIVPLLISSPILMALAIIIGGIILGFTVYSESFKYQVIGISLIIVAGWILVSNLARGNSVSGQAGVFVLIFLAIGLILVFGSGKIAGIYETALVGEDIVSIPVFATIECQQSGASTSATGSIDINGEWISRRLPKNTNEWSIRLRNNPIKGFSLNRQFEYYICNSEGFSNCREHITKQVSASGDVINLGTLSSNDHIWVQYQREFFGSRTAISDGIFEVTYKPFILVRSDVIRGGVQDLDSNLGCTLPTNDIGWLKRIIQHTGTSDINVWTSNNVMQPGQKFNYITGNVLALTDGNVQNGGWCVYENNQASIYEVEKVVTGEAIRYNRVNFDNKISSAQCCNGESYPNGQICKDGKFISVETSQCTTRADCGSLEYNPFPGDLDTVQRAACINNKCTFEQKQVECTISSQCRTNEFCSRNTFTCITATNAPLGSGESRTSNITTEQEDCDAKSETFLGKALGSQWVVTTTTPTAFQKTVTYITFGAIGDLAPKTSGICKDTNLPYFIFGGIGLVLVIGILALMMTSRRNPQPQFRQVRYT